ncbi:hypothetical protein [Microbulbifer sp. JMSA003]|uniref:hypothetical protein n=1 Tax=unclassified Microbulbifer TaxID=2619833 RepID=UPI004039527F
MVDSVTQVKVASTDSVSQSGSTSAAEAESVSAESSGDLWFFGSSKFRMDGNGDVRLASSEEILGETKSSPSAMVDVLSTGADLLRFDANGYYQDDVDAIAALHAQADKTTEEIAEEVQQATVDLRNKMRADIEAGVFTVDDAGQVYHNGVAIPPESVGFELNALLIESLTNQVSELNQLKSDIVAVDGWVQAELEESEEDHVVALYDIDQRCYIEKKRAYSGGSAMIGASWGRSGYNDEYDFCKWHEVEGHESDFDKFAAETFPEMESEKGKEGDVLMDSIRSDYDRLMEGSGLTTPEWGEEMPNKEYDTKGPMSGEGLSQKSEIATRDFNWENSTGAAGGNKYRGTDQAKETNRVAFDTTTFTSAKENINARVSTLSTVTEQLGTNLNVDNSRYNNLIEAMNNYNKSVLDSLKRFSIY